MEIQLNRIILFAKDTERLKIFYQQHFNFSLVEEIKNEWVVLKAGPVELAFHKIGAAFDTDKEKSFKAHSNTKLVFEVDDDLASFRQHLLRKALALKELKKFPGNNYLHCDGEDPEGNIFQLRQKLI